MNAVSPRPTRFCREPLHSCDRRAEQERTMKLDFPAMNTISLMQPYFFPYLGYFDLLCSSDTFVFYDDVAFSKNGWFNRNRIYSASQNWEYIRVAVRKSPLSTPCNQIGLVDKASDRSKLLRQLGNYRKSPYYYEVSGLVDRIFDSSDDDLASVAMKSVELCADYIGIDSEIKRSSDMTYDVNAKSLCKVLAICRITKAERYLNLPGGRELYCSDDFAKNGLELAFTPSDAVKYEPRGRAFVPYLSVLDALMWEAPGELKRKLCRRGTVNE